MDTDPERIREALARGEVRRVLAIRVGRVGDTLHVRPALELLRAALPEATLVWLCSHYARAAARGAAVDACVPFPHKGRGLRASLGRRRARRELERQGPFDLALGLEDKPWGRRLAARLGCRFWHAESCVGVHVVERKAGVLAGLGLWDPAAGPPPPIRWSPAAPAPSFAELPRPRIGLQVGSHALRGLRRPRRRRDPNPAWLADFAARAHRATGGGFVVNAGRGGAEARAARSLARALARARLPHRLLAAADLDALGAALACLDALVSANTGPAHLAAALGVPLVLLEGPAASAVAGPWRADAARVLSLGLSCSPCGGTVHGRRCRVPRCLDELSPAAALAALRELLGAQGRAARPGEGGESPEGARPRS